MKKISLAKIWNNRKEILEGVFNLSKKDMFVESVSEYRMNICNTCAYKSENKDCALPGTGPCCGACGCSLKLKTRSLSSACGAIDKGEDPKWLPIMSVKQEDALKAKENDLKSE
jgi:hypothetical protein